MVGITFIFDFYYINIVVITFMGVTVDGHKSKSSSARKQYDKHHACVVPEDLLSCFRVLKKCKNKLTI